MSALQAGWFCIDCCVAWIKDAGDKCWNCEKDTEHYSICLCLDLAEIKVDFQNPDYNDIKAILNTGYKYTPLVRSSE